MLLELSSRQIFNVTGLGIGAIITSLCGYLVFKRNPNDYGNRLTSLGYLSIVLGIITNIAYVLLTDKNLISFLHRLSVPCAVIASSFLFLAALYISEGEEMFNSSKLIILIINLLIVSILLIIPGVTVHTEIDALPATNQFIEWSIFFYIPATIPVYIILSFTAYYYIKIWKDIPSTSTMKLAFLHILSGTIFLGVSHFLLTFPHLLWHYTTDIGLLITLGNSGAVFGGIAAIVIYIGYRRRIIADKSEVI